MVSGVDSPVVQSTLIEASTAVVSLNQAKQGAILNSSQLVVGKQFQGEILTALQDGTFIVKVADIAARMQLPDSPQVGSKLSLTLLTTSPRATFLLNSSNNAQTEATTTTATLGTVKQLIDDFAQSNGLKSNSSTGLYLQAGSAINATNNDSNAPRLITLTNLPSDSAPTSFSSTGKLVNELMQNTSQQTLASVNPTPLANSTVIDVTALSKALQQSVSTSGVFYESHLLQWAEGTVSTAELMKEPQASFSQPGPTSDLPSAPNVNPNPTPFAANLPISDALNLPVQGNTNSSLLATSNQNNSATSVVNLPKAALPIIQQQLQTMEQQRFVWHGELTAGQPLDWEISRDNSNEHQHQAVESTWNSSVHFELPQLGNISAQLQLTGAHLKITITTNDAKTALMLKNQTAELAGALNGTGAQLDSIQINNVKNSGES